MQVIKVVFVFAVLLLSCVKKFHLQAFFVVSLCLFLTSSALLLSDYKEKDSLALRQTVARLPSLEAPALIANLQPLTSIAREAFVQVPFY